jgi:hypothetical protein
MIRLRFQSQRNMRSIRSPLPPVKEVGAEKPSGCRQKEAHEAGKAGIADADGGQNEHAPMGGGVAAHENTPGQQHGHAKA